MLKRIAAAKEGLRTLRKALRIVRLFLCSGLDLDALEKRLTCQHDWTRTTTWKWNEDQGRHVPQERVAHCPHCERTELVKGDWFSFDGRKVAA